MTKLNTSNIARVGPHRYRRPRRRPLVGPTGSPYLDYTLVMDTKSAHWFRRNKTLNSQKKVSFRDEAIISMSVAGEVTDSSIVEVGRSRPQFQYTREELMEIKVAPLSKRRPDCLDSAYNNKHGIWDPERWHLDRKRSETPPEDEPSNRNDHVPENHAKRRSGDPRERIRKEQDGIVLSPQRRSFNSGCFVNVSQPPTRRPESPLGKAEVPHREPVRRIGSGRILNRDMWDFRSENDKLDSDRSEFSFRPGGGGPLRDRDNRDNREAGRGDPMRDRDSIRDRDDRNDRYERRSFGRDFGDRDRGLERNERNQQNDRDKDRGRDRRYGNDRRRTYSDQREIEEPEWFSSGPTSQHDTIELRGFEDIPEEKINNNITKGKKQSPAQKKRAKKAAEKEEKQNENHSAGPKGRSTPNSMEPQINVGAAPHSPILEQNEQQSPHPKEKSEERKIASSEQNSNVTEKLSAVQNQETKPPDFNLDDFLKSDTFPGVPGLLTNGVGSNGGAGSRFSQWFKRESPVQQLDSRKPSIQDELLNNLLNDISEPKIKIPSVTESNAYFAPISPAASTAGKFIEMLQRGNKANQNGQGDAENPVVQMMKNSTIKDAEQSSKPFLSLEELEARMRGGPPPPVLSNEPPRITKTDEDLSAFKKLLAQVTGGQAVPAANGPIPQKQQPFTLMQFINTQLKSQTPIVQHQNPEPMRPPTFNHVGPLGPVQHPHQSQLQHENLMKVLQVQQQQQQQQQQQKQRQEQQQMLSMMMGGQRMMGVSPIPPDVQMMVNCAPATRELLQRPEAQAIIHGLQQGEITRQHLVQQLQNPAMQHRHREVLVNILKVYGGTTPRTVSPHASAPTPQDHMLQQMLYQQQQQQQRIPSPMNNVIPHRVPSPREIAMHTQTIIQNALIKKKLEEQRENFRKRQEQQQHHQQQKHQSHPNAPSPVNSPAKQTQSPTPLAFTPTSVLRKMTAEKEPEGANQSFHHLKLIISPASPRSYSKPIYKVNESHATPATPQHFSNKNNSPSEKNFHSKHAKQGRNAKNSEILQNVVAVNRITPKKKKPKSRFPRTSLTGNSDDNNNIQGPDYPNLKSSESKRDTNDLVSNPKHSVSDPKHSVSDSKDLVSDSKDLVSDSKDLVSDPKDLVSDPKDLVSGPKDLVSDPKDLVSDSKDSVSDSKDLVSDSKDLISDLKDSVSNSKDSVPNLKLPSSAPTVVNSESKVLNSRPKLFSEVAKTVIDSGKDISDATHKIRDSDPNSVSKLPNNTKLVLDSDLKILDSHSKIQVNVGFSKEDSVSAFQASDSDLKSSNIDPKASESESQSSDFNFKKSDPDSKILDSDSKCSSVSSSMETTKNSVVVDDSLKANAQREIPKVENRVMIYEPMKSALQFCNATQDFLEKEHVD